MRVGLLGGTFDPVHLGHLRAAETVRESLALDLVALVPSGQPPHRSAPLTPAADRLEMARLATASHPAFCVFDLELRRTGPSYTVDTVEALLRERPGDSFVLIVGGDTWPEMTSWRDPQRLFSLVEVAVAERPGAPCPSVERPFTGSRPVHLVRGPALAISATAVREQVRRGCSVRYLVPDAVAEYISNRRLYC